jgi:thiamine pyridinylase
MTVAGSGEILCVSASPNSNSRIQWNQLKERRMQGVRSLCSVVVVLLAQVIGLASPLLAQNPAAQMDHRHPLRVVLYPFIPEFTTAADTIKRLFESENPDVELVILDLNDNYYAPPKPGKHDPTYIGEVDTDVYELDSVFLADFVKNQKIQPLSDSILLPRDQLLKNAYNGSMLDGKRYGSAHWVCGNFLFYTKDHPPSTEIRTLRDVETFVGSDPKLRLLVDMRGRLTLGEFYLGTAYAKYKDPAEVQKHILPADESLEADLVRLLKLCPVGSCRDQIFHEDTGIYGQEFALGRSKALIGYSELLHSVLKEGIVNGTVADGDLRVSALPLDDAGTVQISWVDSFAIGSGCKDECLERATRFLRFMQRDDIYLSLLLPDRPSFLHNPAGPSPVPAYLLPAKASLYSNPTLKAKASLYPQLRSIIEDSVVPTSPGLNQDLRTVSTSVDAALNAAVPQP